MHTSLFEYAHRTALSSDGTAGELPQYLSKESFFFLLVLETTLFHLKMSSESHIHSFLQELPKCEHHVHLEGTLSPELLFKLADRNDVTLPADFPKSAELCHERYDNFADLQDFLDHYYVGMSVLLTKDDFENLAWDYFVKAHSDGVHHAEVFFDPQAHLERGIALHDVVGGFTNARERAHEELGISTQLIMCLLRHLPGEDCLQMVHDAKPHFEAGHIVGLGLDSSEQNRPPHLFTEAYAAARDFGLDHVRFTAHAGEEGGPDYVDGALNDLQVERIDHGVRSVEDEDTLKRLAENKTLLTVCPMSNLKLRVVDNIGQLPLRKLIDNGVHFSINSDDPAYFGGYILDNYKSVHEHFNLDLNTWCTIAENSINGSWVANDRKKELLDKVDIVRAKYSGLLA